MTITVREGGKRHQANGFMIPFIMIANMVQYRGLIWKIYKRDFINGNKRSFLGFAWYFVGPLVTSLSWILMNMAGVLQPGELGVPYPVYVLLGSSLWMLFSSVFGMSGQTLNSGRGFITQVSYPHEVLMVKQLLHAVSIFTIGFLFNLVLITLMGYPPSWKVVFLPFLLLPLMLLACGLGLVCSILFVVGDIEKAIGSVFGLVVYTVPVYYSLGDSGLLGMINRYNPLTYLFVFVRDVSLFGESSYLYLYLLMSLASVLLFLLALRIFYLAEMRVIERLG